MGLMQTINTMFYTPFFHLCEREKKFKTNKSNYPQMIQMLITQVDNEKDLRCFAPKEKEKHWADLEYVHELTNYTCFHWLAYHNDYESINYIIEYID